MIRLKEKLNSNSISHPKMSDDGREICQASSGLQPDALNEREIVFWLCLEMSKEV